MSWDGALWTVAVLFSSVLAGGVITVSLAVIPALRRFAPATDFQIHRVFNPLPDLYMPHSLFISAFATLAILIGGGRLTAAGQACAIAGVALSVPIMLISLLGNRRINLVIRRWAGKGLPRDYARMRRVWDRWHVCRSVLCLVLLGCYIVAAGSGR